MKEQGDLQKLVKEAVRPPENADLSGDLWPRMLRRLDGGERRRAWLDWALAGVAAAWMIAFPQAIPCLLYHL